MELLYACYICKWWREELETIQGLLGVGFFWSQLPETTILEVKNLTMFGLAVI